VEKRARPGNEGHRPAPSAQQQATVAELVPEVVLVQSGVVGALDRAASDDRLQKE
jgi:hypothetical protein